MKILYVENIEGALDVRGLVNELLDDVVFVSNLDDALYNIMYVETEFDIIVIGDNLEALQDFSKHPVEEMHDLNYCKYFPVGFGKVCIELCKKCNKKIPKIVLYTTTGYYRFNGEHPNTKCGLFMLKEYIEDNNMQLINKTSRDFYTKFEELNN